MNATFAGLDVGALIRGAGRQLQKLRWRFGPVHPAPVFVLGNHKSGTTAIAALIAARMGTTAMLDIFYRLGDFSTENRLFTGELTLAEFVTRHRRFFRDPLIKDPSLTFFDLELRHLFPKARFLFIVRDPRDNLRSILNRLDLPGKNIHFETPSVQEAMNVNPGWRAIMEGKNPPSRGTTIMTTMARRWSRAAEVYLARPDQFLLIRYEDFCDNKVATINKAIQYLGRSATQDIRDLVDHQFQPKGDHSVTWQEFFGEANLTDVVRICRPAMTQLGYDP